nr:hypothetical protein [Tanacetum cinerariifolium]
MASSGGRRCGGRGSRGVGSTRGGGMAGSSSIGILTSEELDEMAFGESMEEQSKEQANIDDKQEREDSVEEAPFNQAYVEVFVSSIHSQPTQQSGIASAMVEDLSTQALDKGKGKESVP